MEGGSTAFFRLEGVVGFLVFFTFLGVVLAPKVKVSSTTCLACEITVCSCLLFSSTYIPATPSCPDLSEILIKTKGDGEKKGEREELWISRTSSPSVHRSVVH